MELADLIATYRQRADDAIAPYFTSDATLALFASEGEREAAVRARLISDTTSDATQIAVTANTATYALSPLVDVITDAIFTDTNGRATTLTQTDQSVLDRYGSHRYCDYHDHDSLVGVRSYSQWRTKVGRPRDIMRDGQSIRLHPIPDTDGTLVIECYRLPLYGMEDGSDEPEIPAIHHDGLVNWMLYRVYSTKDEEVRDDARATDALVMFTAQFGPRRSAVVMRQQRENRRNVVRYGGI